MVYTGTARGGYSAIGLQVYLMLNWAQSARHKILCKDLVAVSSSQFFCMYVTSIPTTCMPYVAARSGGLKLGCGTGRRRAAFRHEEDESASFHIPRGAVHKRRHLERGGFFTLSHPLSSFFSTWVLNLIICPSTE